MLLEVCLIIYKINKNKKYYYRFYEDKLVYKDTIFLKEPKVINYEYFKEITYLPTGVLRAKENIGDIYISTKGQGFLKRTIILKSIPDANENCKKIVELIEKK